MLDDRVWSAFLFGKWNVVNDHINYKDAIDDVQPYVRPLDVLSITKVLPVDDISHNLQVIYCHVILVALERSQLICHQKFPVGYITHDIADAGNLRLLLILDFVVGDELRFVRFPLNHNISRVIFVELFFVNLKCRGDPAVSDQFKLAAFVHVACEVLNLVGLQLAVNLFGDLVFLEERGNVEAQRI